MRSDQWLSVSLLLALCSNASLLFILTFKALHNDGCTGLGDSRGEHLRQPIDCPTDTASAQSTQQQGGRTLAPELKAYQVLFARFLGGPQHDPRKYSQNNIDIGHTRQVLVDKSQDQNSLQENRVWQAEIEANTPADVEETGQDDLNKKIQYFFQLHRGLLKNDLNFYLSKNLRDNNPFSKNVLYESSESKASRGTLKRDGVNLRQRQQFDPSDISKKMRRKTRTRGKRREKRDSAVLDVEAGADGNFLNYEFQFSKLTENETSQFSTPVSDLLIPGLKKFEDVMIRHVEELHFAMLSHDLRLERIERAVLNLAKQRDTDSGRRQRRGDQLLEPVQSDDLDRLAEDSKGDLLFPDDIQGLWGNASLEEGESSGESDINGTLATINSTTAFSEVDINSTLTTSTSTTTTTSTTSTTTTTARPTHPIAYYDLQRDMQTVRQKVLALENYNTMSDSELNRVRSEVMMMDDKVIEMQRVQNNANSVASQHTYKLNELEMIINRNTLALATTVDSYGRISSRVKEFRDRVTEFEREMHGVTAHFSKHEQIANELRSADSYKAHDIMEIRKSMLNVETRLNEMYNVMDQTVQGVRTDIDSWLERVCYNNALAC